jgi:hypothetical protein
MFEMDFTGLCLFVPTSASPAAHVRALLIDTTQPSGGSGHLCDLHEPLLIVNVGDVDGKSTRQPDLTFLTGGAAFAAFLLRDQELSVPALGLGPVTFDDDSSLTGCNVKANYGKLSWLAHLAKISAGSDVVRPACFNAYPNADGKVAARVRLHKGDLSSSRTARDYNRKLVLWDFQLPDGSYLKTPTSLSERLMLVNGTGGSITLHTEIIRDPTTEYLQKMFSTTRTSDILLTPTGDLKVLVANSPLSDIMQVRPRPTGPRDPDVHFDYFYDVAVKAGSRNIPVQINNCNDDGQPSLRSPQCPPALGAPNNMA